MVPIASQQSNPARLALCDCATHSGSLEGAWWPKSTDLRTELPDLVAILSLSIGAVYRVVYGPAMWPHAPSRIIRGKAQISVDPYSMLASDTIFLIGTHSRDAVLYLVPPSSREDVVHPVAARGVHRDPADERGHAAAIGHLLRGFRPPSDAMN